MTGEQFRLVPIGRVRAGEGFALEIAGDYRPALRGLEEFSHVAVLWWCHLLDDGQARKVLETEEPYRNSPPKLGIFATRSPRRPNPIALSVAPILGIDQEEGLVHVAYIDAEDGTPIVDLKPYHPSVDRVREASVPAWCAHWPRWYEDSAAFDWAAEFVNAR